MTRIAIVGAGIGGLTAAVALRQRGFEVAVFEQAREFDRVGAGITLAPNAMRVLQDLALANAVYGGGNALRRFGVDDKDGKPIFEVDLESMRDFVGGHTTVAIHRAALHNLLLRALPDGVVRTGQRLVRFAHEAERVVAHFDSGISHRADLLVGCDGLNSEVRTGLFGPPKLRWAGQFCWRGVCPTLPDEARRRPVGQFFESWGRGLRFGYVHVGEGQTYWYATRAQAREEDVPSRSDLLGYLEGWHEPVAAYIESTPESAIIGQPLRDVAPTKQWSQGRVVLLGDAVHPTTPNMGQGACMAIESAAVLAQALRQQSEIGQGIATYVERRRGRTREVTRASWQMGQMTNWRSPLACGLRNSMMRMTPSGVIAHRMRGLFSRELHSGRAAPA